MINIKRFEKKFNLYVIEEVTKIEEIEGIKQAATITEVAHHDSADGMIAVIDQDDDITPFLDKVKMIIFTRTNELTPELLEKAKKYGKPAFWTKYLKRETASSIDAYILRKTASPIRVHGTLLSVFGEGVLITGKSGIGKSELALELINRKHIFVGDDAIDIVSFAGTPIGRAPAMSREFIEVRGVGIINLKGMFGIQSILKEHYINLIIELVHLDDVRSSIERLGRDFQYREIAGSEIPTLQVPVASGRSIASVVEAAVISYKQRIQDGYVAVDDLTNRLKNSK